MSVINGYLFTEGAVVLNHSTGGCSGLTTDVNVLHNNQTTTSEPADVPVLGEEVQRKVRI